MPSTNIILLIALFYLSRATIAVPLNDSPNVDEDLVINEDLEKRSVALLDDSLSTDEDLVIDENLVIDEDLKKRYIPPSNNYNYIYTILTTYNNKVL